MHASLKLVSNNPRPLPRFRSDARSLRRLADRLTEDVRCDRHGWARELAACQSLSPIGIAAVATWMARAGLSEADILQVMASGSRRSYSCLTTA